MKKLSLLMLASGLVALLSGCFVSVTTPSIDQFVFASDWHRRSDNAPVICQAPSTTTTIGYRFKIANGVSVTSWTENWSGEASNLTRSRTLTLSSPGVSYDSASRVVTVTTVYNNTTDPFSRGSGVSQQAIFVSPTPVSVPTSQAGRLFINIQVSLSGGGVINLTGANWPVYNGCVQ